MAGAAVSASPAGAAIRGHDNTVYAFGTAPFHGSTAGKHLNAPIVGMNSTPKGKGYLLVASDGGVFTFGGAKFHGSTGSMHVKSPVVGIAGTSTGGGYWLATKNGGVFHFGDAKNQGGAKKLLSPLRQVTQITSVPGNAGYRLLALPAPLMIAQPLGVGSAGPQVTSLQTRLLGLGYWLPGVTGVYDSLTQQAVFAFQKYSSLPRTGSFGLLELAKLSQADRPVPRSTSGYMIEIDKTRQVIIVANNGHADWVFNASSGSDHPYTSQGVGYSAHTPEGNFNVIRSVDGYDKSPLGQLYRPRYFTNTGIAVHGYTDVPPYPASHGCVRVSNAAMDFVWNANIMPIGSAVWVYL